VTSLISAAEAVAPDIIIPCDDRAVDHLHQVYARCAGTPASNISSLIERSLGSPASFPVVSARFKLMKIAGEEGLRIAATKLARTVEDLRSWQTELPFPWVLKADGTWGGHGVRIASNRKEAERSFVEMSRPLGVTRFAKRLIVNRDPFWVESWWNRSRPVVTVQPYIAGRPANCAVACWEGKVLAGTAVEVMSAQGPTGSATIVRVVDNPEMMLAAERLAHRLGMSGFFGLDFMIEEGSGAPFLIEMNPRCTPLCNLQLGEGRDLIGALSAQISGKPIRVLPPVTQNDVIAYFPQSWHWDGKSKLLESSFHDVPWEEPELVRELLQLPWPDRSILARLSNRFRRMTFEERAAARGGVFAPPSSKPQSREDRGYAMVNRVAHPNGGGAASARSPSSIVPIRRDGAKEPLFLIHGVDGTVARFESLVSYLEPDQPAYGIQSQALLPEQTALTRVEEMARYYLAEVRAVQPQGPYHFLGYSFGGLIAFEIARQLSSSGDRTGLVGMLDTRKMAPLPIIAAPEQPGNRLDWGRSFATRHVKRVLGPNGLKYASGKVRARWLRTAYTLLDAIGRPIPHVLKSASDINWFAAVRYTPQFFPGKVTLFQAMESPADARRGHDRWAHVAGEGVEIREISGRHEDILAEPHVQVLARKVSDCLAETAARQQRSN
jgi:thioesterase domain-containing protein